MGGHKTDKTNHQLDCKNFHVATIQFAYRNEGLISHLQKRGIAIGQYNFDKAREHEANI